MIIEKIASELNASPKQIQAAVTLLDEGATVPFIARYRKEVTQGLDDTQLRNLEQRLGYLRDLEARRKVILKSINEQGKLEDGLKAKLLAADNKTTLEDLYLPYKPRRRTKGQIAIEAGLEPLANELYTNLDAQPETLAEQYVNAEHNITDTKAALDGAKFILMERFSENADLLQSVRQYLTRNAHVKSTVAPGKETEGQKYKDYFDYTEKYAKIPSHRALA
ncbi:MAG: hypothetical protein ACI9IT_000168, partial [Glaciecola sp.]